VGKVTSKLQVTVPKTIADQYRIKPGDEIAWVAAGEVIRIQLGKPLPPRRSAGARLRLFDEASARQKTRNKASKAPPASGRGWTREDLYGRGRPR
jgi:bifunctional DNA-binding transcriptional regulator/antitoxin component of YhaV-PrlF toxin-antitoxin module